MTFLVVMNTVIWIGVGLVWYYASRLERRRANLLEAMLIHERNKRKGIR